MGPHLLPLLAAFLVCWDLQNGLSWSRRRVLGPSVGRDGDFTILVPVYGHPRYFAERDHFARWKPWVLVLVECTAPGMDGLCDELEAEGWRVRRQHLPQACSPAMMLEALEAGAVETTFVLRMDADTVAYEDLRRFVAAMRADGADLCSVKCHAWNASSLAQKFQRLEYRMAMRARHYRPALTSGACYFARTQSLLEALRLHSLWWAGEDVETGWCAHALRMRIRHLDMEVYTDVPVTWRALLRQRRLWWAANFRHAIVNLDRNLVQRPTWAAYYVLLVWAGVLIKWDGLLALGHPGTLALEFLLLWLLYVAVTAAGNAQVLSPWMLVYPPYALVQAMLMPWVGACYYVVMVRRIGNLGRYRFGYKRREPLPALAASPSLPPPG